MECSCCLQSSSKFHQSLDEMDFQKSIHQAVLEKNFDKVQKFVEKGHVNQQDQSGFTPLLYAVGKQGDLRMARLLLENGANPNLHTRIGRVSCLHRAVLAGNAEIVKLLLEFGADSGAVDLDNRTVYDCLEAISNDQSREMILALL
jgi:ankyrin repeat protein